VLRSKITTNAINPVTMPTMSKHEERAQTDAPAMVQLANFLEQALDIGSNVVVMEPHNNECMVGIGNPYEYDVGLRKCETLSVAVVDEMLRATNIGMNELIIGEQAYRFARSFLQLAHGNAVVFSPS
jgi:hypothetical protein